MYIENFFRAEFGYQFIHILRDFFAKIDVENLVFVGAFTYLFRRTSKPSSRGQRLIFILPYNSEGLIILNENSGSVYFAFYIMYLVPVYLLENLLCRRRRRRRFISFFFRLIALAISYTNL